MPRADYLFCPADRPDRVRKAALIADVVIVDLEDAVAARNRTAARVALVELAAQLDPAHVIVRVNATNTSDHTLDLAAVRAAGLTRCMLPKAETRDAIEALDGLTAFALCETPLGVLHAAELAEAENCVGLMWGSEDLAASLGAWSSRDGSGLLRSPLAASRDAVLMAARAAGVIALDTVFPDVDDEDGLGREASVAAEAGWDAKACIHPAQLAIVRAAFRPSADRLAWADEVLALEAAPRGGGVALVRGAMVDAPVLRAARRVRELAEGSRPCRGRP